MLYRPDMLAYNDSYTLAEERTHLVS